LFSFDKKKKKAMTVTFVGGLMLDFWGTILQHYPLVEVILCISISLPASTLDYFSFDGTTGLKEEFLSLFANKLFSKTFMFKGNLLTTLLFYYL
jgi:hypothetical protein